MLTPSKARSGARWQRERGHHIVGLGPQLDQAVVRMTRCQISLPSNAIAAATVATGCAPLDGSIAGPDLTNVAVFGEHPKVQAVERDGITLRRHRRPDRMSPALSNPTVGAPFGPAGPEIPYSPA